jgi:iron complex outermembrane receptor protein
MDGLASMSLKCSQHSRLALALALAFPIFSAQAEDASDSAANPALKSVVVTGTRVEHDPMDVPASVAVINRDAIVNDAHRVDLTEDINGIPGLQGNNRYNYAQDLQVSSRGFGARSTFGIRSLKLYTDGIPASMADGQGQASTFNLDQAQRIEVLQGPMSSVYGNQAGGVIQLFTREGQGKPEVDGSVESGSFRTWKSDAAALGSEGGVGYLLDTSSFHTDGYRPDSAANRDQSMAKLTFSPNPDGKLTITGNHQITNAQDPLGLTNALYSSNPFGPVKTTASGSTPGYPDLAAAYQTRKFVDHNQLGANWTQRAGENEFQLTTYMGTRGVTQFQSATALSSSHAGVVQYDRNFYGTDARLINTREFAKDNRLTITAGMDFNRYADDRRGYTNFTVISGASPYTCGTTANCGVYGTIQRKETDTVESLDPYLQAEWAVQKWLLTAGVRYSRVNFDVANTMSNGSTLASATGPASGSLNFSHTTPMLSVVYKLNPNMNLYASASEGFETPTMNEMFYKPASATTVSNIFNFGLKAATIRYYETGVKTLLTESTQTNFALYHILVNNEAVVAVNSNGSVAYQNADTRRDGVEWSLDSQITSSVSGKLALTALRATYPNGTTNPISGATVANPGNHLPGVAERSAYAQLLWQPVKSFNTGLDFIARGHMFVEDTNAQMAASGYGTLAWHMALNQQMSGWKFKEFARVDNITNRTYVGSVIIGDANGRYYETAPPRNTMIGASATYQF